MSGPRITWDTETHLIGPGRMAPPIVCGAFRSSGVGVLYDRRENRERMIQAFRDQSLIVGHNVAYDFLCLAAGEPDLIPQIFAHYDRDLVSCTMIRQQLIDIAQGRFEGFLHTSSGPVKITYSLEALASRHLGINLDKGGDTWRLRYAELEGVPIDQYPEAARAYPLLDVEITDQVWERQEAFTPYLEDEKRRARAYFALALTSAWGIWANPAMVQEWQSAIEQERERCATILRAAGVLRKNGKKESRNMARIREIMAGAWQASGLPPEELARTPTGEIQTDGEACEKFERWDPTLAAVARFSKMNTKLTKDLPYLLRGVQHTRFGMAESGRTTSKQSELADGTKMGANIQNLDRLGWWVC